MNLKFISRLKSKRKSVKEGEVGILSERENGERVVSSGITLSQGLGLIQVVTSVIYARKILK